MICSVTCLNCGYNGGGHASMVSFEREGASATSERAILSRCLVNVGDGTQRFCNENREKLSTISSIIVTSLAPHNLAGFPGVFLSLSDLGVGNITVIGPPGIKSSIDLMLPFTNRKYPVLDIHEIDQNSSSDSLTVRTDHLTYNVYPVYSSKECSRVMAIGASIHCNHLEGTKPRSNDMVTVYPIPYYFESYPAIADLVESSVNYGLATFKKKTQNLFLFVPLAVSSFDSGTQNDTSEPLLHTDHFIRLQNLCAKYEASGIMSTGNLSATQFEFTHAQSMLSILNSLCKPIFPEVAPSIKDSNTMENIASTSGALQFASPMLTVTCGAAKNGTEAVDDAYLWKSVTRVQQRNALTSELYRSSVMPRLQEILSAQHRPSKAPPALTGPPNPPIPPMPMPLHKRAQSEMSAPPYPLLPVPITRGTSVPLGHSSSLNILTDMSSLSSDTFSSLASDEPSDDVDVGTPSPQSNFGAASALREKLLAKRKLSSFSSSLPPGSSLGIGFESDNAPPSLTEATLKSCAGSEKSRTVQPVEEEEVSTTPLKSLRLNDSSKHRFIFSTAVESPHHALDPTFSTAASSDGEMKQSFDFHQTQQQESFARSAFNVPPPNPFGDVCTVTFLGTGSATPSKYRNGSCIMLTLNNNQAATMRGFNNPFVEPGPVSPPTPAKKQIVLLDCGEGTATQMFQSVASDVQRFDEILLNIKIIWISHHHADHITGVPMLLEQIKRAQLRREAAAALAASNGEMQVEHILPNNNNSRNSMRRVPTVSKYDMRSMFSSGGYEAGKVMIIGSEAVLKYFEFSACVAGLDDLVTFSPIVNTLYAGATVEIAAATNGVLTRLRSIPVQHCHSSYGLVLDFQSQHKIVYSGDCRPSQSLVKAGINCDLLIHEATFDDSKQEDAVKKRHSTSSEARRMAVQMRAKHTVLTHFSQRYPLEASSALQTLMDPFAGSYEFMGHAVPPPPQAHCAAVAYDFLKFSFPSQAAALPLVTAALGSVLTALEEERRCVKQCAEHVRLT